MDVVGRPPRGRAVVLVRRQTRGNYFDTRCDAIGCGEPAAGLRAIRSRSFCAAHLEEVLPLFSPRAGAAPPLLGCGCGPELCADCAATAEHGVRVLVVGERINVGREKALSRDQIERLRHRRELSFLLRLGGIKWGPSRDQLLGCGVRWDQTINLLMPAKIGEWDAPEARIVADGIRSQLAERFETIVLLGVRVAEAFRHATGPIGRDGRFLSINHPSPRSRVWNDSSIEERTRAAFREALSAGAPFRPPPLEVP